MNVLPTVSIIVPNYNHSHFLTKAIERHLSQTVLPLEIIIVDDGSSDESVEIISKFAKSSSLIHPIFLEKNRGVNEANNKGLAVSKGDYIFSSAVDDIVSPQFLEKSLNILARHPQAGFSFCDPAEYILKTKKKLSFPLFLTNEDHYFSPEEIINLLKTRYFTFPSNTVIYNRKYLSQMGGFLPSLERGSDWFACFSLALRYGVCYLPRNLAWFCVRDDSYSAVGLKSSQKQKTTYYKISDTLSKNAEQLDKFKKAGILYEYSWRSFLWTLFHKNSRKLVSFIALKRLLIRSFWGILSPHIPYKWRILLRKIHRRYADLSLF